MPSARRATFIPRPELPSPVPYPDWVQLLLCIDRYSPRQRMKTASKPGPSERRNLHDVCVCKSLPCMIHIWKTSRALYDKPFVIHHLCCHLFTQESEKVFLRARGPSPCAPLYSYAIRLCGPESSMERSSKRSI